MVFSTDQILTVNSYPVTHGNTLEDNSKSDAPVHAAKITKHNEMITGMGK